MIKKILLIIGLFGGISNSSTSQTIIRMEDNALPHYFCTASDERYYPCLLNLIGSIHKFDWKHLEEIAVFNLGMTTKQLNKLKKMSKVQVYEVEMTHPDLLKYFETNPYGKKVRGYYAWKPVAIKQALDMFPYILYLDAGVTILKPLDDLFESIVSKGYFLLHCGYAAPGRPHNVGDRVTKPVIEKVIDKHFIDQKEYLLDFQTPMLSAAIQGLSHKVYDSYVLPMYETTYDMQLYEDDKSAILGWGAGRHDQTLYTIFAQAQKLELYPQGWLTLDNGIKMHYHWDKSLIGDHTTIYHSRGDLYQGGFLKNIIFKEKI